MKREDTEMIPKITLNMTNKCTLMLAQALNIICGAPMVIYGLIGVQKQSYGPATLTISGKAINGETRLLAATAFNSITRGMQCERVVHFPLRLAAFQHYMIHFTNASNQLWGKKGNTHRSAHPGHMGHKGCHGD